MLKRRAIDFSKGSMPALNKQVDSAKLFNAFISPDGIFALPHCKLLSELKNIKGIHYTSYNNRYIVATNDELYTYTSVTNNLEFVDSINTSVDNFVIFSENQQNQITITTGDDIYVFNQTANQVVQLLPANGITLSNPIYNVTISNFTIVIGGTDRKWYVSEVNNALLYKDFIISNEALGNLTACQQLENNLFIFSENGVQRWVQSVISTIYSFPFSLDPSFNKDYGCIATNSITSSRDAIFYLSNDFHIHKLSLRGREILTTPGQANAIKNDIDLNEVHASYYSFKGEYFYHLTINSTNAWVYCQGSKTFSETEFALLDFSNDFAINKDGICKFYDSDLVNLPSRVIIIQTPYFNISDSINRSTINQVILNVTSPPFSVNKDQLIQLQISKDNIRFSDTLNKKVIEVGERLKQLRWNFSAASIQGYSFKFTFYVNYDICIKNGNFK